MSEDSICARIKAEIEHGMEALSHDDLAQATLEFANALFLVEEIADARRRRDKFAKLAVLLKRNGFVGLSKSAVEQALALGKALGLGDAIAEDLCELAGVYLSLDDSKAAEQCYREALALLLQCEALSRAASVQTSLALVLANRGEGESAVELLEQSLTYLAAQPLEQAEINARFALLQVLELNNDESPRAMKHARQLCTCLDSMPQRQRESARALIDRAVRRYLKAYSDEEREAWKRRHLPKLGQKFN